MPFFDSITKRVGDVAKTAAKKSEELVETTKLNRAITAEEDKIKGIYGEIGIAVYRKYQNGQDVDGELLDSCQRISECEKSIESLKEKINSIKSARTCPNCRSQVEAGIMFCPKCGTSLGASQMQPQPQQQYQPQYQPQYQSQPVSGFGGIPTMEQSPVQTVSESIPQSQPQVVSEQEIQPQPVSEPAAQSMLESVPQSMQEPPAEHINPQNAPPVSPKFCSSCGGPISPGIKFCPSCGSRL